MLSDEFRLVLETGAIRFVYNNGEIAIIRIDPAEREQVKDALFQHIRQFLSSLMWEVIFGREK